MIDSEGPFYSDKQIGEIFTRYPDVLERLRESPVKIIVDGGISTGLNFMCEVKNQGFNYTFLVNRHSFTPQDFREALVEVLNELGIAVEY